MPDDTVTQDTSTQVTDQTGTDTTQQTQKADTLLSQSDSTQQKTAQTDTKQTQDSLLTQQVSLVKPDGTFIDGWKDKLPEELRSEECLNLVTDFNEMVKQFVNQRKAIGKNKIALPTDKSDENEWNAFYEAIGRPKTYTGYTSPEIPDGLSDIFTEERINRAKERAYKLGATPKQFQEYLSGEIQEVTDLIAADDEAQAKATREARLNAEKELRAELGAAYDERMHIANRLITEAIPKEQERIDFIEKYGNDITIIRLLSTIGARMSEHTALIGELTQKTPTDIQQRINAIQNNKDYRNINSSMSKEERQQLTDELNQLYKQLYPAKKTG